MDQPIISSPDPLNDPAIFPSPGKVRSSGIRRSLPLDGSSPRKQTFQLDVGNRLSPQKLLVTVEADHSERELGNRIFGMKDSISPIRRNQSIACQNVRTTTTTIPVKGISDSEDDTYRSPIGTPKRGRGRPRKPTGTPMPSKSRTRTVTPRAKPDARRRRTVGDLVDGDDSEDWDFEIGVGVEVSRGKGRSRSRSAKDGTHCKAIPATKDSASPEQRMSSTTSKQDRGRRKTLTPEEFLIHEDEPNNITIAEIYDNVGPHVNGALASRDLNLVPTLSPFSTIRSFTTAGNDDPDILLAKFSPAKRTPAKTGWSSPTVLPVPLTDASSSITSQIAALRPISSSRQGSGPNTTEKDDITYDDELGKNWVDKDEALPGVGELAEFDTILESEGFSMISVDSVPSLREHLSSPAVPGQIYKESTPTTGSGQTERHNILQSVASEYTSSGTVLERLGATTPGKNELNPRILKVRLANTSIMGDSFSSIPSEVLEAATPGRKVLHDKVLTAKAQGRKGNDDSFSSIPPAILEAATPAKHHLVASSIASKSIAKAVEFKSAASSLPLVANGVQSQNESGLLSPGETPSPEDASLRLELEESSNQRQGVSQGCVHTGPATDECSIISARIRSSPPSVMPRRFTYTAHLRQKRALHPSTIETPSIIFSSPSLPPLLQQPPLDRTRVSSSHNISQPPRQSLSPIVRAGRVLQNIATTSPSRSRSQSLGSPFKSPVAPRNYCGINQPSLSPNGLKQKSLKPFEKEKLKDGDIFGGFSNDTRRELRKSFAMGEEFARSHENQKSVIDCLSVVNPEDPFDNGAKNLHSPSLDGTGIYTLGLPKKTIISETGTIQSDGAMSWQLENTVALHTSQLGLGNFTGDQRQTKVTGFQENSGVLQISREAEWSRERAAVSSQIESAGISQVIVISSDDEEEDIWQAEARHSSSLLEEQLQQMPPTKGPCEKPRRSKIPSPWRKHSKRLVYSDELAQLSSPPRDDKPKSNPDQEAVNCTSKSSQIRVETKMSAKDIAKGDELPDSSIMWHIPQKLNFAPRTRSSGKLDLSALLGSSPVKGFLVNSQQELKHSRPITPLRHTLDGFNGDALPSTKILTIEGTVNDTSVSYTSAEESQVATEPSFVEEESETATEPSMIDTSVQYPSLTPAESLSPQKSCLRTPTSISPIKSVTFKSLTPSPPPLSRSEWSKKHWQRLDTIWRDYRSLPADEYGNALITPDDESAEMSKWHGKTVSVKGYSLVITKWHLDIVADFIEEVPGWEEGYIVKRLVALVVGEQMRKEGKANS